MAFRLEQTYTKDEILELYVNSIYFGDGYYCVRDASEATLGKGLGNDGLRINIAGWNTECTIGLRTDRKPRSGEQRQQYVLQQMEKYGISMHKRQTQFFKTDSAAKSTAGR